MKNRFHFSLFLFQAAALMAIISFQSCRKEIIGQDPAKISMADFSVDQSFTFKTSNDVDIKIQMLDNTGGPVKGMRVDILTDLSENNGQAIVSGITDENGIFTCNYKIPAYLKSLVVSTNAIGFIHEQSINVENGKLDCTLGGRPPAFKSSGVGVFKSTSSLFVPLGTYNNNGVPNYLISPNDVIDATMVQDINATLPEYIALPNSHPQYFASSLSQNMVLTEACDVWVTFVHEGAGYRNVLGFYTFQTGNPPATPADIDSIHIIFPNASFNGSGGGLYAGNKVHIGVFGPGTEIGWALIADGFRNGTITAGYNVFYSNMQLNPESSATKKQHTILCNDIGRGKFLLGFEDLRRDAGSDNDFNDAVFYVTANPIQAVDPTRMPLPNYTQIDSDGDGVSDVFDDYPSDASKAFNNYYPSKNHYGTLAFEDLWPSKGDYDFNDMVVDYYFNQITNGQNKVVKIDGKCVVRALGAGYKSGFGFQLPVIPSSIASYTGHSLSENMINLSSNGTEAGQSKATFIAFDNGYQLFKAQKSSEVFGINTNQADPYHNPDTLNLNITFTSPVLLSQIGTPPYNPFIFVNLNRSHEVHLVNDPPTDLADMSLFGTGQDNSVPAAGRYYVTRQNLPWGLNTVDRFDYPVEKTPVNDGFTKFIPWGVSGGSDFFDWFQDKSGYRNTQYIYHK
ncbi:MAG: LruC domain-containing protein [Bacteroidetes bacterium]|nr:LruC domain-containing protein [Bacteroidota bacterium]